MTKFAPMGCWRAVMVASSVLQFGGFGVVGCHVESQTNQDGNHKGA